MHRPSATLGAREARRFAPVAVAVWLASGAAMAPACMVVVSALSPALGRLPSDLGSLPPGELAVVARGALAGVPRPLEVGLVAGLVLLWAWQVLWRAGVTSWRVWAGERRVRLGELLGLGLTRWWPVARVHLTGLAVAAGGIALLVTVALEMIGQAWTAMAEVRLVVVVIASAAAVVLILAACRAATVAGVWRLARPDRSSAVLAWVEGLWVVVRHPLASAAAVLLWSAAGLGAVMLAAIMLLAVPSLAASSWGLVVVAACALLEAAAAVALMGAFAPVSGLLEPRSSAGSAHTTQRSGPPAAGLENG